MDKASRTSLSLNITGSADLCYYELNKGFKIIKVDLTKLNKQQLSVLHDYMLREWGNELLDKATDSHTIKESYIFDIDSLQKIKYFFIIRYSEIGVGSFVFVFPLQKVTDRTEFTLVEKKI
ncbi:hypothetical protein MTZ49_15340 [Entomomonas sp. E2T0]|uniref:hypothetical protein n=1 Tax=Entomomonas sp. E2T0 TaxID=2930213 RepID=UPI0022281C24|nr:hypothetical protein [Entomomonas sp. E2T0]UYZ83944.1 hypothetical protein MTZ49_15340 [Entomomonas sp. E2T0]